MSDEIVYLHGYTARVQTLIEALIQYRLRELPDIREGLGDPYFDQMTNSTRGRWLRAITKLHVDDTLGQRLQSVLNEVIEIGDHVRHKAFNIQVNVPGVRVGSAKWADKPDPTPEQVARAQNRLLWVESWVEWLWLRYADAKQSTGTEWVPYDPPQPPLTPPA